jgi:hypothetical protein
LNNLPQRDLGDQDFFWEPALPVSHSTALHPGIQKELGLIRRLSR